MSNATLDRLPAAQKLLPSRQPSYEAHGALANGLLAALPPAQWQAWRPLLEPVALPLGWVLYEPGRTLEHIYFPTTAIASLLYVMQNGASAEIAMVGHEGAVGIPLVMGGLSLIHI